MRIRLEVQNEWRCKRKSQRLKKIRNKLDFALNCVIMVNAHCRCHSVHRHQRLGRAQLIRSAARWPPADCQWPASPIPAKTACQPFPSRFLSANDNSRCMVSFKVDAASFVISRDHCNIETGNSQIALLHSLSRNFWWTLSARPCSVVVIALGLDIVADRSVSIVVGQRLNVLTVFCAIWNAEDLQFGIDVLVYGGWRRSRVGWLRVVEWDESILAH